MVSKSPLSAWVPAAIIPLITALFRIRGTIATVHIRFRRGLAAQGQSVDTLPFKAMWYPYGTYLALAANIFLIFFQGYTAFLNPFSAKDFVVSYILLPVFVILLVGYKLWKKTKFVKLKEMDIWTGRRAGRLTRNDVRTDEEHADDELKKKGFLKKAKEVIVG